MPKARIKITTAFKLFIFVAVLILALLLFPKKTSEFSFEYSEVADIDLPKKYPIHGIDLSNHNGLISWQKLKNTYLFDTIAVKFVYVKATEGRTLTDSYFKRNWNDAKKHGFYRGAYHFYITTRDPIEQARNFCKNVHLEKGDLPPVCDFEDQLGVPKSKIQKDILQFLDYLSEKYQIDPIIYTNPKLYERIFQENELFKKYNFWIAKYENQNILTHDKLLFWQHNKSGKIPGNSKSIDYNVFLGSEEDFSRILIK